MLVTIIISLAITITVIGVMHKKGKSLKSILLVALCLFCFSSFIFNICLYPLVSYSLISEERALLNVNVETYELSPVNTAQVQNKSIYLVSYNNNGKQIYGFYEKGKDGYVYKELPSKGSNVFINYSIKQGEKARVEYKVETYEKVKVLKHDVNLWTTDIINLYKYNKKYKKGDVISSYSFEDSNNTTTIFYIPKDGLYLIKI